MSQDYKKWQCIVCGWIYDEAEGCADEGLAAGTRWSDVPEGKGFTEPGRQILHCTFGSTLNHPEFGPAIRSLLEANLDAYTEILADHFSRHLKALAEGFPR